MELVLATNNHHKKEEFDQILKPYKIILPGDLGIKFSYEETGATYFDNAYGKAYHLYSQIKRPVIADDSGLSVYCLDGAPGIFSSRYGASGEHDKLPAEERNNYLLSRIEGETDRQAFFVCCIVLIISEYRFYSIQETLEGQITEEPAGSYGFGYDPVFYLPEYNKTVAQLPEEEKNSLSHRGKAGKKIFTLLEGVK